MLPQRARAESEANCQGFKVFENIAKKSDDGSYKVWITGPLECEDLQLGRLYLLFDQDGSVAGYRISTLRGSLPGYQWFANWKKQNGIDQKSDRVVANCEIELLPIDLSVNSILAGSYLGLSEDDPAKFKLEFVDVKSGANISFESIDSYMHASSRERAKFVEKQYRLLPTWTPLQKLYPKIKDFSHLNNLILAKTSTRHGALFGLEMRSGSWHVLPRAYETTAEGYHPPTWSWNLQAERIYLEFREDLQHENFGTWTPHYTVERDGLIKSLPLDKGRLVPSHFFFPYIRNKYSENYLL